MLLAFVPAAAQDRLAGSHAKWMLNITLVTQRLSGGSTTSAKDIHSLVAETAIARVALCLAKMATGEQLLTRLVAMRDFVLASLPRAV